MTISQHYNKIDGIKTFKFSVLFIGLLFFLYGCGLFLSPFNVVSYENFTSLKALHLKLIDDFTDTPGKTYDQNKIEEMFNMGDLKFREALEYETQNTKDRTRTEAFEILYDQFRADYKFLVDRNKLYNEAYAKEIKNEVEKNYNLAIKGELSRRNTPTN